jgi:surface antigen
LKNNDKKPFLKMKKAIFLKTCGVVLMAATTAILIAMAACKQNPTTPTTPITTTTFEDTFGTYIGSFNSVNAYSNRVMGYLSYEYNYLNGTFTGMKWQCVEYVQRYYLQIYGMNIQPFMRNADSFYSNASGAGLLSYPNGGSVAPQVGDIICSNGGNSGHVAIVREVGSNYINVIHQNWSNSSSDNSDTISRNGNTVNPFNLYSGYPIVGWLRSRSVNLK